MILYTRLDIYPNRDGFYIHVRPIIVDHQSRECKRQNAPSPSQGRGQRDATGMIFIKEPKTKTRYSGLTPRYCTLPSRTMGAQMQMQMWYSKILEKDKARDSSNLQGVDKPSEGLTLSLDFGLKLTGLA